MSTFFFFFEVFPNRGFGGGTNSGFESGTNIALMVGLTAAKQRVGLMVAKRGTNIDKKWD